jgi:hypothetical protein
MEEPTKSRTYAPDQRPDVEVRVDDRWWPAEVRSWSPSPSGWWANCSYHPAPGRTTLDTFHQDDVRKDQVDRSYGRDALLFPDEAASPPEGP